MLYQIIHNKKYIWFNITNFFITSIFVVNTNILLWLFITINSPNSQNKKSFFYQIELSHRVANWFILLCFFQYLLLGCYIAQTMNWLLQLFCVKLMETFKERNMRKLTKREGRKLVCTAWHKLGNDIVNLLKVVGGKGNRRGANEWKRRNVIAP